MLLFHKKVRTILIFGCLYLVVIGILSARISSAADAKKFYEEAAQCHDRLINSSLRQKFRQFWLTCLNTYERVYSEFPESEWAPTALYQSGVLYLEFYQKYKEAGYQKRGLENIRKVIEDYPDNPYKTKASQLLQKTESISASNAGQAVKEAPVDEKPANMNPSSTQTDRQDTAKAEPPSHDSGVADVSNASPGYGSKGSPVENQRLAAIEKIKRRLAGTEPPSTVSIDLKNKDNNPNPPKKTEEKTKEKAKAPHSSEKAVSSINKLVTINRVKFFSRADQTRMVIYAGDESPFFPHLLEKDQTLKKPRRFYVDIENARLGKNIERNIPIDDRILYSARTGQFSSKVARVVVDFKSFSDYKIYSLKDPFRIVVDFWGANGKE